MRRLFALLFTATMLLVACRSSQGSVLPDTSGAPIEPYKRYHVERGLLRYALTGPQEGTETILFDRWGMRERKETQVTLRSGDTVNTVHQLTLVEGPDVMTVDLTTLIGRRTANRTHMDIADRAGSTDIAAAVLESLRNVGAVGAGTQEIAGQTCEVWTIESAGASLCLWQGIPLRTVVTVDGVRVEAVAEDLDVTAMPTDADFLLPEGVMLSEATSAHSAQSVTP
jgi:hypothetical protein